MLVQRLALRVCSGSALHELIAVQQRFRDTVGTGRATGARDVLDHDLLAESLRHSLGEKPPENVRWASGTIRHDECHRSGRPILRI